MTVTDTPPTPAASGRYTAHQPACPACCRPLESRPEPAVQAECPHEGCSALLSTTRRCAACQGHAVVPRNIVAWRCSCTAVNVKPGAGHGENRGAGQRALTAAAITVAAVAVLSLGALAVEMIDSSSGPPSYSRDEQQGGAGSDTDFQNALADAGLYDESVSKSSAAEFGHTICDALDDGADARAIAGVLVGHGLDLDDTGTILGSSVAAYCPENLDLMLGQLEED